jgi:hypothetical protein
VLAEACSKQHPSLLQHPQLRTSAATSQLVTFKVLVNGELPCLGLLFCLHRFWLVTKAVVEQAACLSVSCIVDTDMPGTSSVGSLLPSYQCLLLQTNLMLDLTLLESLHVLTAGQNGQACASALSASLANTTGDAQQVVAQSYATAIATLVYQNNTVGAATAINASISAGQTGIVSAALLSAFTQSNASAIAAANSSAKAIALANGTCSGYQYAGMVHKAAAV